MLNVELKKIFYSSEDSQQFSSSPRRKTFPN